MTSLILKTAVGLLSVPTGYYAACYQVNKRLLLKSPNFPALKNKAAETPLSAVCGMYATASVLQLPRALSGTRARLPFFLDEHWLSVNQQTSAGVETITVKFEQGGERFSASLDLDKTKTNK